MFGGFIIPSNQEPITRRLCIIMIAICILVNILYSMEYQYVAEAIFFITPGFITPGIILANIAHYQLFHLLSNLLGLCLLGTQIESLISAKRYIMLLIISAICTSGCVWFFGNNQTIGFSGIVMGLVAYMVYRYESGTQNNTYSTMLLINIAIGFLPGISFLGHIGGAIGGLIVGIIHGKITGRNRK